MQRRDILLAAVLVVAGIIFIGVPLIFLLMSALPQPACVGLVKVNGVLTTESADGWGGSGLMSSDDFTVLMEEAKDRSEIKAVVFEINSPGGSVVASGEMYRAVKELDKPKVMFGSDVGTMRKWWTPSADKAAGIKSTGNKSVKFIKKTQTNMVSAKGAISVLSP